jgi:hypothetical protein
MFIICQNLKKGEGRAQTLFLFFSSTSVFPNGSGEGGVREERAAE